MDYRKQISELERAADEVGPPLGESEVRKAFASVLLQESHLQLMARMNGASFASSYITLFGVTPHPRDVFAWNDPSRWKFAWDDGVLDFFFFAETALGEQFAVRYDAVIPCVYRLTVTGSLERVADSFEHFLEWLSRQVRDPNPRIVAARSRFPRVPWDKHVQQVPPELFVGRFDVERLRPMSAIASMVATGDVTSQINRRGNAGRRVVRIDSYVDEEDRARLKVVWADEKPS